MTMFSETWCVPYGHKLKWCCKLDIVTVNLIKTKCHIPLDSCRKRYRRNVYSLQKFLSNLIDFTKVVSVVAFVDRVNNWMLSNLILIALEFSPSTE